MGMIETALGILLLVSVVGNVLALRWTQRKNTELLDRLMARSATEAALAAKIRGYAPNKKPDSKPESQTAPFDDKGEAPLGEDEVPL
jgi:hypothetical protein